MERKNAVCFCRIFCNYILFILLFAFISAVPIGMLGYGQNVYASEIEAGEGTTLIEYAILLPDGKDTVTDIRVNGEKYDGAIAPVTENGILSLLLPNATQTVALTFDDGEESYLLGPAESSPTVEPYSNVTLFTHNGNSYYRTFMKCYYPYSGTFTVTGNSSACNVTVLNGTHRIILDDLQLIMGAYRNKAAIDVLPEAKAYITLKGSSVLKGSNGCAGLQVAKGASVTIDGNGELTASSPLEGAGIGGKSNGDCGDITILSGIITANGGKYASGIGGGKGSASGKITVDGGSVYAVGDTGNGAQDIGGGANCAEQTEAFPVNSKGEMLYSAKITTPYEIISKIILSNGETYNIGKSVYEFSRTFYIYIPEGTYPTELVNEKGEEFELYLLDDVGYISLSKQEVNNDPSFWQWGGSEYFCEINNEKYYLSLPVLQKYTGTVSYKYSAPSKNNFFVTVASGSHEIHFVDLILDPPTTKAAPHFSVLKGAVAELVFEGSNFITATDGTPGIYVESGGKLIISGDGSLHVSGGAGCAGIGGYSGGAYGEIVINNAKVTANGGNGGAGIGGGSRNETGGRITVNGGTVNAFGGKNAAGIGGGSCGSGCEVIITGGNVYAEGDRDAGAEDIGKGSGEDPTLSSGTLKNGTGENAKDVELFTIPVPVDFLNKDLTLACSNEAELYGNIKADGNSRILYVYIPKGTDEATLNNGSKSFIYRRNSTQNDPNLSITKGNIYLFEIGDKKLCTVDNVCTEYTGNITVSGKSSSYGITIESGNHNITLKDLYINMSGGRKIPFKICEGACATVTLAGNNLLEGGHTHAGIQAEGGKVIIYGTGTLTATGGTGAAGIGSGSGGTDAQVTIYSGTITANGGENGAGIGSSAGGTVIINGGTVYANGGKGAAGIGNGASSSKVSQKTVIIINNATVHAVGGAYGAGIGGGKNGHNVDITINKGEIVAEGGVYGAGIGGGDGQKYASITIEGGNISAIGGNYSAGIGTGNYSAVNTNTCDIRISGGTVTAIGRKHAAGIGGGKNGNGANVIILGGNVKAVKGKDAPHNIGSGYSGSASVNQGYLGTDSNGITSKRVFLITIDTSGSELKNISALTTEGHSLPYGLFDVTPIDGKLYIYLHENAVPKGLTADGTEYKIVFSAADRIGYLTATSSTPVENAPLLSIDSFIELFANGDQKYFFYNGKLVEYSGKVTVTGSTASNNITVHSGEHDIIFKDLNIDFYGAEFDHPFLVCGGAKANIFLEGDSVIKSNTRTSALFFAKGGAYTVNGNGTLTAIGCDEYPGIGGQAESSTQTGFTMNSGTVYATSENGPGIGDRDPAYMGHIVINGGKLVATGMKDHPGISKLTGDITINGGYVEATGGTYIYSSTANAGIGYNGPTAFSEAKCNITVNGGALAAKGGYAKKVQCYAIDGRYGLYINGGNLLLEGKEKNGISCSVRSFKNKSGQKITGVAEITLKYASDEINLTSVYPEIGYTPNNTLLIDGKLYLYYCEKADIERITSQGGAVYYGELHASGNRESAVFAPQSIIRSARISLGSSLNVKYYCRLDGVPENGMRAAMIFTFNGKSVTESTYRAEKGELVFTFRDIPLTDLSEKITCELVLLNEDNSIATQLCSASHSVEEHLLKLAENGSRETRSVVYWLVNYARQAATITGKDTYSIGKTAEKFKSVSSIKLTPDKVATEYSEAKTSAVFTDVSADPEKLCGFVIKFKTDVPEKTAVKIRCGRTEKTYTEFEFNGSEYILKADGAILNAHTKYTAKLCVNGKTVHSAKFSIETCAAKTVPGLSQFGNPLSGDDPAIYLYTLCKYLEEYCVSKDN